ncbi:peptidase M1 [Hyunsoonleella sp. SJ7]|uniref:Aminopeptidase N n=1 Tax=Hyunsoonleella aquatilis TaxID=2762758 RepID=A0A923KK65_9FLAO|nr:M1 family aminopeptidase [Hyunsoonleella aquatilis]MBC3758167.1 peptidase M1 [Hyunsoonleella aquatilis]
MFKPCIFILGVLLLFSCTNEQEKQILLGVGIPSEMAQYRKEQVSDVVYHLTFDIPLEKSQPIPSAMKLELQIHDLTHPLYLDFNEDSDHLKAVAVNGNYIPILHEKEHLIIDPKHLTVGENVVEVSFDAGELSLNRNTEYLYTLLVPDRASTLFPCFDQPNIKARYVLDITAPKTWQVLCGAPLETQEEKGEIIRYKFKPSDLMSTYLFSFVAGDFNKTKQEFEGFEMAMLYRETDEDKITASTDEIFTLHYGAKQFLEDYTQYPFPFQKMDFATIPGFQYGGMEHTGAIQYREPTLFLDENATKSQELGRAKLIAHETAHMWFGNLVTMDWFDDVWLKEVFANFMADKITAKTFPEVNHQLNFMREHYASAYSEDRTQGATPIKQQLDNLKNAGTIYGRIIYNKAPIMMRQLEALVGEDAFRKGMQNYIQTFANGNADWSDMVAILDDVSDEDVKAWSKVWVYESGRPIISDSIVYENDSIKEAIINQKAEDGSSNIWPQSFSIGLVYPHTVKVVPVHLKDRNQNIEALVGLPKPQSIIYNYDAFGYGVFPIDTQNLWAIPKIEDKAARGYAYINLYENVLAGNVRPTDALNILLEGVSHEKEELILGSVSGYASSVFWNYLSEKERVGEFPQFENKVRRRLLKSEDTKNIKKTLFYLFEGMGYSEKGIQVLHDIWAKKIEVPNLKLNENDYTGLAFTLALFEHEQADSILKTAIENISNPDRKERAEFLLPSVSRNEAIRDGFMASLMKAENREKESWVLSGLYNLNHPLRQKTSINYLKQCLELTEEIQLTGDIFFPKGWLSATIGSYSSEEAYVILETFLKENPNFPEVLKNKLLQASDKLYRAKRIREKV